MRHSGDADAFSELVWRTWCATAGRESEAAWRDLPADLRAAWHQSMLAVHAQLDAHP